MVMEYMFNLKNGQLRMHVSVDDKRHIEYKVYDNDTDEEYILYKIPGIKGQYVSELKAEIDEIIENLTKDLRYHSYIFETSKMIIKYIEDKYHNHPIFPWDDTNCVFKHHDEGKWYGVMMHVDRYKLDGQEHFDTEVLNIKLDPELIDELIDDYIFFRAFHMNKKYWISIDLDRVDDISRIYELLDMSFRLTY